jgi:hypothetical protein
MRDGSSRRYLPQLRERAVRMVAEIINEDSLHVTRISQQVNGRISWLSAMVAIRKD